MKGWPKGKPKPEGFGEKMRILKNRQINDWDYEWPTKSGTKNKAVPAFCRAVKRAFGSACEVCGYDKPEINNHCHHILERENGGKHTIRNACVLCSRCHDEVHAGILSLPVKILERTNGT